MSNDIMKRLRHIEPFRCGETCLMCDAADEIQRLRALADDLAHHLRGYVCHCNMSKCKCGYDDVMDAYEGIRDE